MKVFENYLGSKTAGYLQPFLAFALSIAWMRPFTIAICASLSFPDIEDVGRPINKTPTVSPVAAAFCSAERFASDCSCFKFSVFKLEQVWRA